MEKVKEKWDLSPKNLILPGVFLALFWGLAVFFAVTAKAPFYLFNFGYIGTSVALGIFLIQALPKRQKQWGRRVSELLVGLYMLFFLGFFGGENMQIEVFFSLLLSGVFAGATLHYLIAKIAGPLLFGRAWCSYACWTAMVLDFLPYREPKQGRIRGLGALRYLHFFLSLGLVLCLWLFFQKPGGIQPAAGLYWLIAGNLIYYAASVALAFGLRDNRAFCKVLCPIPVLMKLSSRFSLMKLRIDPDRCTGCGRCEKVCPMNVALLDYKAENKRVLATECIWCGACMYACPKEAVDTTVALDAGGKDKLRWR